MRDLACSFAVQQRLDFMVCGNRSKDSKSDPLARSAVLAFAGRTADNFAIVNERSTIVSFVEVMSSNSGHAMNILKPC